MHREVVVVRSSTVFPKSDSLKLDSVVLKTKSVVFKTRGSLKPDSVVLKTKSVSFRTRVPLKPDSVIPKTLLNRCLWESSSLWTHLLFGTFPPKLAY